LTASLLNTYVDEAVKIGIANKNSNHLSPYIGVSVKPLNPFPVRIRAYYKNTYRLPTFGDMYYSTLPNPNLKAENAHQYDLGLTFIKSFGDWVSYVSFSGDVYYYRIENKIFAWPKSSMALWSVENYGKVDIRGIDLNLEVHAKVNDWLSTQIKGTYTHQDVLDKTDSNTRLYNQQLPYTPRHSATVFASLNTPWVDFNYNLIYSGKRYYYQINLPEYQLKAFADQGISFTKDILYRKYHLNLSAECLNIFNEQYDVVRSYPMPGRSYRFGIKIIY
jgi:outer membrane receptor protein involved in Fe transport